MGMSSPQLKNLNSLAFMLSLALIVVLYYSQNIHVFSQPKTNIYSIVLRFQLILKGKVHPSHLKNEAREREDKGRGWGTNLNAG
jgi:hypothetical protein